ncbi:MAG: protease SohB [Gammaproteobacteria bacterium]
MLDFLAQYSLFLLETITLMIAILFVFAGLLGIASKNKANGGSGTLKIKQLNEKYQEAAHELTMAIMPKKQAKQRLKAEKKADKEREHTRGRKIFVLHFDGDIRASAVDNLRQEITAILTIAKDTDEVVVCLKSPGGVVHTYGLAASQLQRIVDANIHLTVAVDEIAASGGYLMASVAHRIIAAPFAIIGSIGVVAQLPNFHRWLKKHNIDVEQITAGKYKRTLTVLGENTREARDKFQQQLEDIHALFKTFVGKNRPAVDLAQVATGEYWLAAQALELKLVDTLQTSDDYLLHASEEADLYEVRYQCKKSLKEKFNKMAHAVLSPLGI